ncbi:CLK4-associating serine/arginine rich protein [Teleopsis dalmanni]|uniref:CLK4-associating serine/arginine rich protein n=1 Tax=Teleopsis dalmanni TaxID=139649 RepID=UPI0018CD3051|nr:CLK4-associating serine/arginine rich protein [Teleopsis dalmanni]
MWHEARKQERRIKTMIVDYRKRAERRQDFYEKIQADPTQFLQIHGRRCKIHLDQSVAMAGDSAAIMMPWQGQQDNMIDRFDARSHLDYIYPISKNTESDLLEIALEERQCNYERYRILAQNDFLCVPEEKFLHQLHLEEQYGVNAQLEAERNQSKKKQSKSGATIGYTYETVDHTSGGPQPFSHLMQNTMHNIQSQIQDKESDSDSDSYIDDMDVSIDVTKLDTSQAHELNAFGRNYGMISNDFYSYLTKDADEAEALRLAREEEQEKILLSGRKSRRERRAQKERRIACRPFSPPSYAAKEDATKKDKDDDSDSRSPSPTDASTEKITYITSFGAEDELQPHSKISISIGKGGVGISESYTSSSVTSAQATYAQKVKENLEKLRVVNELPVRKRQYSPHRYERRKRRSRSRSYDRYKRGRSRSGSRERSRRSRRSPSVASRSSVSSNEYNSKKRHGSRRRRSYTSRSLTPKSHRGDIQIKDTKTTVTHEKCSASVLVPKVTEVITSAAISYPQSTYATSAIANSILASSVPNLKKAVGIEPDIVVPPPPPLKRYYGRKRENTSSSESESDNTEKTLKLQQCDEEIDTDDRIDVDTTSELSNPLPSTSYSSGKQTGKYTTAQAKNPSLSNASETKGSASSRLNLRERLKRKMQNLLNKQYKADKRAEIEKTERERQLQQEREDEMRELALKLRRRQRELRHRYGTPSTDKGSDSEHSEHENTTKIKKTRSRSKEQSTTRDLRCRVSSRSKEKETHNKRQRDSSRDRKRMRSRSDSRSYSHASKRRTRSRSRSRRSPLRRGQRSPLQRHGDRYRHQYERSRRSKTPEHRGYRDRLDRYSERNRHYGRESERHKERLRERTQESVVSQKDLKKEFGNVGNTRNKVVISAPPKLKKLVDY